MNRRNNNTINAPEAAPEIIPPSPSYTLPTWKRAIYFAMPFLIYLTAFFGPFLEYDQLTAAVRGGFLFGFSLLNDEIFKETGQKLTRPRLVLVINTWKIFNIWIAVWLPMVAVVFYRHNMFKQLEEMFNMAFFWMLLGWVSGALCVIVYALPLVLDWWIESMGD